MSPTDKLEPICPDYVENVVLQERNPYPQTKIQPKRSKELKDNRIGFTYDDISGDLTVALEKMCNIGLKWVRMGFWSPCPVNWQRVLRAPGVHEVDRDFDQHITELADNDINIVLSLGVGAGISGRWATPHHGALGDQEPNRWFKTQDEIDKYLDFARYMARHFRDRIQWYEIWNEPDAGPGDPAERGGIDAEDYANVSQQLVPVVLKENPDAKIVIGAVGRFTEGPQRYVEKILRSGAAPLADAISWHPFYGDTPSSGGHGGAGEDYWRNYPGTVDRFRERASSLGFTGGYMVAEMVWRTPEIDPHPTERCDHTELTAAKYQARATLLHLGLDMIMADNQMQAARMLPVPRVYTIRTLCTVMAGARASDLPLQITTQADQMKCYRFTLPDGSHLVSLWDDIVAHDTALGVNTTVTIQDLSAESVVGIDTLNGFEQPLRTNCTDGNVIIPNLVVRDYPLLLHLKKQQSH